MGSVNVIFINERYERDNDIRNLIAYIAAEGKNSERERSIIGANGVRPDAKICAEQVIQMQTLLSKNTGRRMYQMTVSFPQETKSEKCLMRVARKIGTMLYVEEGFANFYGLHLSKKNKHIHFAINSVSLKGTKPKKWHKSKSEFAAFKDKVKRIAEEELY